MPQNTSEKRLEQQQVFVVRQYPIHVLMLLGSSKCYSIPLLEFPRTREPNVVLCLFRLRKIPTRRLRLKRYATLTRVRPSPQFMRCRYGLLNSVRNSLGIYEGCI